MIKERYYTLCAKTNFIPWLREVIGQMVNEEQGIYDKLLVLIPGEEAKPMGLNKRKNIM